MNLEDAPPAGRPPDLGNGVLGELVESYLKQSEQDMSENPEFCAHLIDITKDRISPFLAAGHCDKHTIISYN